MNVDLTPAERQRLKDILGTIVSRGINPNTHNDKRVAVNRADLTLIIGIFNKVVALDKETE